MTCKKRVRGMGFGFRECGRLLRTDEQKAEGLCGRHLAGKKNSQRATEKFNAEWELSKKRAALLDKACRELDDKYGIKAYPGSNYNVVVNAEGLLKTLQAMAGDGEDVDGEPRRGAR